MEYQITRLKNPNIAFYFNNQKRIFLIIYVLLRKISKKDRNPEI